MKQRYPSEDLDQQINEAESLMESFSHYVNVLGKHNPELLLNAFLRQHRTLQQGMIGAMVELMIGVGSADDNSDLRNMASTNFCMNFKDWCEDNGYTGRFPTI